MEAQETPLPADEVSADTVQELNEGEEREVIGRDREGTWVPTGEEEPSLHLMGMNLARLLEVFLGEEGFAAAESRWEVGVAQECHSEEAFPLEAEARNTRQ